MKKIIVMMVVIFATTQIQAQKAVLQVEKTIAAFKNALINADSVSLDKLTTAQLNYGHSSGKVEDKAAFIHALVSGQSDFVSIDFWDQQVKVAGRTASVRHILAATTNDNGIPGKVRIHVLTVWVKNKNNWKLLARQAVKMAE